MSDYFKIYPRYKGSTEAEWLYKTRKYITIYETYNAYKLFFGKEPVEEPLTLEEIKETLSIESQDERDMKTTALISSTKFTIDCINNLLNDPITRDLGIALAVEFQVLDILTPEIEDEALYLYLTENSLTESEAKSLSEPRTIKKVEKRISDKSRTMFTILTNNFSLLLDYSDTYQPSPEFIADYLEHSNFFGGNPLLQKLLERYPNSHPCFETLDCLSWDPFTKSRRYRHWLGAKKRMDEIRRYYSRIESKEEEIIRNKDYIAQYENFINLHSQDNL